MADLPNDVVYEVFELPHVRNQLKIDVHGRCEKCLFWQSLKDGFPSEENNVRGKKGDNIGECRFNAPAVINFDVNWPTTYEFDWCGQYKARAGKGGLAGTD